jgi:flagellin-like hook-associated protein FlgL
MEANILKSMTNFTTKFAKSVVKLTTGLSFIEANDEFEAAGANLSASGSRIVDVDSAREIIEFTKTKILSRAAASVSGQANQLQRDVINLIR